jgi:hypothetical protein
MKWSEIAPADTPAADAGAEPKPLKWSQVGKPAAPQTAISGVSTDAYDPNLSLVDRLWRGIQGKDVSLPGRIGMGMADPVYGTVQGAAHLGQPEAQILATMGSAGGPQEKLPPQITQQGVEDLDRSIQQREQRYEGARQSTQPGQPVGTDWARIGGNIASPVTLGIGGMAGKAALAAPSLAGRLMPSILGGAAMGAAEPVTRATRPEPLVPGGALKLSDQAKPTYGGEKLKQIGFGGIGGLAGGVVGEGAGKLISSLVGHNEAGIRDATIAAYRTLIKPGRGQRSMETQLKTQDRQILGAVDQIIQQRKAATPGQSPQLPQSLREFTEALDENKRFSFQQYDLKKQEASAQTLTESNPHLVPTFERTGVAVQEAMDAVKDAQRGLALTNLPQNQSGRFIAEQRMQAATQLLQRAQQQHSAVKEMMGKPYVDLTPLVDRLKGMASDARFADWSPVAQQQIQAEASRLQKRGFYGLTETQDVLQSLNAKLSAFYRNPTPSDATKAVADAEMAGMLRQQLDEAITNLSGPGYSALKQQYANARQIEREVVAAYQREANKIPGGIGGVFADLWATEAGLKAVMTLNPHALGTALAAKGAKALLTRLRSPNRAVARLFAQRAGSMEPESGAQQAGRAIAPYAAPVGGFAGSQVGAQSYPWLPSPPLR